MLRTTLSDESIKLHDKTTRLNKFIYKSAMLHPFGEDLRWRANIVQSVAFILHYTGCPQRAVRVKKRVGYLFTRDARQPRVKKKKTGRVSFFLSSS